MSLAAEILLASVQEAGAAERRAVQSAVALAVEHGLEHELLALLESRSSQGARWLRAALTEKVDGAGAARKLWAGVVTRDGCCEIPDALLHRARAAVRSGEPLQGSDLLRLAFQGAPDHDFFLRAEAVVRKCRATFGCQRRAKIALLGSSTSSLLRGVLQSLCLRDRIEPEFYEPPFGTYMQELMRPGSGLQAFRPDFVVLLLNWRDLGLPTLGEDASGDDCAIQGIVETWRLVCESTPAHILQFSFVPPEFDSAYALSSLHQGGRAKIIRRINQALYERAPERVTLLDAERIASGRVGTWDDPIQWSSAKLYPAAESLPLASEQLVSCVRAELGLSRKLLILDLDNTLWGGTVGEDGVDGIQLGPPSAIGERYQDFQRYLKAMKDRGVLLAVASKNNPEEAAEVFLRHSDSVLQLDDFVAFHANWDHKAASIKRMAEELRLALDSFVFLDDNPAERGAVRRELPDVIVPEISGEPCESMAALERGLYFQATRITADDRQRHASYRAITELRVRTEHIDDYLADLGMEIECGPVDAHTSVRVMQLINKTNQFNLTTRRYTLEEIQRRVLSPDCWSHWYRLRDRFADYGLIGVLLADRAGVEWSLDTWLLSCRVIGRGVEDFMFRDVVACARQCGVERLCARYIPTARNQLVQDLLPRFGFVSRGDSGEFLLEVGEARVPDCTVLQEIPS